MFDYWIGYVVYILCIYLQKLLLYFWPHSIVSGSQSLQRTASKFVMHCKEETCKKIWQLVLQDKLKDNGKVTVKNDFLIISEIQTTPQYNWPEHSRA